MKKFRFFVIYQNGDMYFIDIEADEEENAWAALMLEMLHKLDPQQLPWRIEIEKYDDDIFD